MWKTSAMRIRLAIGLVLASATLAACSSSSSGESLTIGAFNFSESQILAEVYAGALRAEGYDVSVTQSTNREVLEPALESGEVQMVPEYLGTITEFLNLKLNGTDAAPLASGDVDATYAQAQGLGEKVGITFLTPSPAIDQNAFAVNGDFAIANGLLTMSDLAALSATTSIRLGGPPECPQRPFCQPGLEGTYGLKIAEFVPLDAGGPLTKAALADGTIDVGLIFSSDGSLASNDFLVLEDDLKLQQVDNVVPAVLTSVVTPELTEIINAVSAALTTDELIRMNKAVDIDRMSPADVAAEFLAAKGLA
jgi:osmoprotectant transport system substrate-binding protein